MIYILRHGLDDEKKIGGWSETPLLPEGIEQVVRTIQFMKENQLSFHSIYSSDIPRARETAQLVSNAFEVPIILDSRLRELNKGRLTGLEIAQAKIQYPNFKDNVEIDETYPDGESMIDLYKRQKEVLKWLLLQDNILIVTHRGPINMYYFTLHQEPLTNDKKRFGVTHASLHELNPKQKILKKIYDPMERGKL